MWFRSLQGVLDFPQLFLLDQLEKAKERSSCLARKIFLIKLKFLLLLFLIFKYKLENFYRSLRKDLNDHFKDISNELLLLKIDSTQV